MYSSKVYTFELHFCNSVGFSYQKTFKILVFIQIFQIQAYHALCENRNFLNKIYCLFLLTQLTVIFQELQEHKKTNHVDSKYTCNICEKTFTDSFRLRRHKNTHPGK